MLSTGYELNFWSGVYGPIIGMSVIIAAGVLLLCEIYVKYVRHWLICFFCCFFRDRSH